MNGGRRFAPTALLVALSALLTLTPAGAAQAQTESVRSGHLTATADLDPWHLSLAQPAPGPTLGEDRGTGSGPTGTLGFQTAAGWFHATRAVASRRDGDALVATLATTDPLRQIDVRVAPAGEGGIALDASVTGAATADVQQMGIGFGSPADERLFGFGERSNAVDQRGRTVDDYVSDGPFSPDTRPFVAGTIPPWGYSTRDDATYYPVPWLLSSRGYGALVRNDERSLFRLGTDRADAWSVEVAASSLRMTFFAGPTPAAALARFTAATGRQPPPPAPFSFGPWFQTGQPNTVPLSEERSYLDKLQSADAPVSVAETQLRYLPCGLQRGNEDYERKRVEFFHSRGLAILTYVNPMLCASYSPVYDQASSQGVLQKTPLGTPFLFNSFVGGTGPTGFTIQPVAQFDFTAAPTEDFYGRVLAEPIGAGHDGWMEDFGEYTAPVVESADGTPGPAMHNRYPTTYHCGVFDIASQRPQPRPLVRFQRSGWTGAARCAVDVWGGDPTTTFGYDGLSSAVKQALSIGMSGVSRWGSDIGGYDTLGNDPRLTPELLARWIEFGAVSGVMRTKASGLALPSYQRPEIWDPGTIQIWRRYAKLHTQLYPYILAADAQYRRTGLPLMRALALIAPADSRAAARDDEFGFGPDLLAAPVIEAGATRRSLYLPRGRWLDFNRSVAYRTRDGSFHVRRAATVHGKRMVTAHASLAQLPLYLRAGAILPLLAPDVATLSGYGSGVVHLNDRLGTLRLLAFPHGSSSARMFESERLSSRARPGVWRLGIAGVRTRTYRLEASTALLPRFHGRAFVPCSVRLGRREIARSRWSFDARRKLLRVRFRARRDTLTVRACGAAARPAPAFTG